MTGKDARNSTGTRILIYNEELHFEEAAYGRGDGIVSPFVANTFFAALEDRYRVTYMSPLARGVEPFPPHVATSLPPERFLPLPVWTSVSSFARRYAAPGWRRSLRRQLDDAVADHDVIWNRQPAWGGLILTEFAVAAGVPVLMHIAGDIAQAWKHPRYAGLRRNPARLASWMLHRRLLRCARSPLVLPLCTGSFLTELFSQVNPRSEFFIDSTVGEAGLRMPSRSGPARRFLFVGRLTRDKGILLLLDAFRRLLASVPDARLTVIGSGELDAQVRQAAAAADLSGRCTILGFLPQNELDTHYQGHDVLVLPTTLSEGFPRVIIEAWARGLPVITTDVGGIRGLATPGRTALFCRPGSASMLYEAMVEIASRPTLCDTMRSEICEDRHKITREYYQNLVVRQIDGLR